MAKKTKGKHRLDKYYHLAKEQGYRSRAAFKLIQLNRKYNFLGNCRALLDLCAAPGGWLQVAAKNLPLGSLLLGVDLAPIKPIRGAKTFVQDITSVQCRQVIKKEAGSALFDCVLHDGAPNVGGAWNTEAYTQAALVLDSLKLATEFLAPHGTFVTKVFRSKDYNALLYALNQLFGRVEATKPAASRNASAEIFVVCLDYKAPARIDPRLLQAKYLFQDVQEVPRIMGPEALLREKVKQRRHRDGYAEGLSTTHKVASAVSFLLSAAPVELLGRVTRIALHGPDAVSEQQGMDKDRVAELADLIRRQQATTTEVANLCKDLQVLGRSEFKQLIKWRLELRKALKAELEGDEAADGEEPAGTAAPAADDAAVVAAAGPEDPEERLLTEMQQIRDNMERRKKKERKRAREAKQKARIRSAQTAQSEGMETDGLQVEGEELFSLSALNQAGAVKRVSEAEALGQNEMEAIDESSEDEAAQGSSSSDSDEDDDLKYELQMEEALDESYQQYLARKGVRDAYVKEKRKRLGMDGELEEEGPAAASAGTAQPAYDLDHDADEAPAPAGDGLLVELDTTRAGVPKTGAAMAKQWFSQELFNDPNLQADLDEDEPGATNTPGPAAKKARKAAAAAVAEAPSTAGRGGGGGPGPTRAADSDDEDEGSDDPEHGDVKRQAAADDFEVVPQEDSDGKDSGTDSDDEYELLDDTGKAEVLALAKRMLRRKDKESVIDAAYNRYAFHDEGLPRWFQEDEQRHMRPIPVVTKEEVEEEKARLRAIDARPIKKVTEAKARKRKRLQVKLTAAREKATVVAAQDDLPTHAKMREIEKLYAKARATGKGKAGKNKKRKGPPLDKRMRSDKRGDLKVQKRMKGKKGGKAGGGKGKGGGAKAKGGKAGGRKSR